MSVVLLIASALAAASGPATAQPATESAVPAKPKRVCTIDVETGSLAKRRKICKTPAEWDAQVRAAGDKLEDMRRPINSCGATSPGGC
jgi:predicted outer membrane protein